MKTPKEVAREIVKAGNELEAEQIIATYAASLRAEFFRNLIEVCSKETTPDSIPVKMAVKDHVKKTWLGEGGNC